MTATQKNTREDKPETDIVGTLMSLTVAFTMAMAFRGFVLEGFVIPTGSMGPTLMGAHARIFSPVTGFEYPADVQTAVGMASTGDPRPLPVFDPMISTRTPIMTASAISIASEARNGDRVLVLKPLFAFTDPQRWDVVVFKNPTDPAGDTQNYIKRMVGLPGETFLLFDGDVFTGAPDARTQDLKIARKPEFVQRAVWQPVYDSDFEPIIPVTALETAMKSAWSGPPWKPAAADTANWKMAPSRSWTFSGMGSTTLDWTSDAFALDDWSSYNSMRMAYDAMRRSPRGMADRDWRLETCFPVSDLRLRATIECPQLAAFTSTLTLTARSATMKFSIKGSGEVTVTRSVMESGELLDTANASFAPRTDGLLSFECWHVDQQLWVFINGSRLLQMPYEFKSLDDRVTASMFGRTVEQYVRRHADAHAPTPPRLAWTFETAAPFTLRGVKIDRDLYYRPVLHDANNQFTINGDYLSGPGFATNYEEPARLSDHEYVMLGDNSSASRDGRLWGRPHALTLKTFGDAQPGVVPREMIVGKAWAVYFPAPIAAPPLPFAPDFGRIRFIR
ncbi:MAG: S26 family signal peptidase [Planctomycetota bacterium]|nr:S26 family signal peptidase [Planctomycetota bacterium]